MVPKLSVPKTTGETMDNDLFEVGLAKRKGTLGAEFVCRRGDTSTDQ